MPHYNSIHIIVIIKDRHTSIKCMHFIKAFFSRINDIKSHLPDFFVANKMK